MVRAGRGGENCITTSWTKHWLEAAAGVRISNPETSTISYQTDQIVPRSPRGDIFIISQRLVTGPVKEQALRHAQRSPLPVDRYLPGPEGRSTHSKVFVSCSRAPWTIGHVRPRFDFVKLSL